MARVLSFWPKHRWMSAKLVRVTWPDQAVSFVTLSTDERGYAIVKINGTAERLANLHDYRTLGAVELELYYVTRKAGAKLTAEESGNDSRGFSGLDSPS